MSEASWGIVPLVVTGIRSTLNAAGGIAGPAFCSAHHMLEPQQQTKQNPGSGHGYPSPRRICKSQQTHYQRSTRLLVYVAPLPDVKNRKGYKKSGEVQHNPSPPTHKNSRCDSLPGSKGSSPPCTYLQQSSGRWWSLGSARSRDYLWHYPFGE
eukprot:4513759-Amphidinium_carterae.1